MASVFVLGWAILILGGCEEAKVGSQAKDFFWPRTEGSVFVYETSYGTSRHTKIAKVAKSKDGTTYVETLSWDNDEGESSGRKTTYEIPNGQDVVMTRWEFQGYVGTAVVLKGPIAVGTQWPSAFSMTGPTRSTTKTVDIKTTGVCSINRTQVNKMLSNDTLTCMEYSCPMESQTLKAMTQATFCRGVGKFESSTTIHYMNGGQKPFTHKERLIRIR